MYNQSEKSTVESAERHGHSVRLFDTRLASSDQSALARAIGVLGMVMRQYNEQEKKNVGKCVVVRRGQL